MPFSHLHGEWQVPEAQAWFTTLAERFRLVRLDPRGSGMSQRDVADLSISAFASDYAAVADATGIDRFCLLTEGIGAQRAVAFDSEHPRRLTAVVVFEPIFDFIAHEQSSASPGFQGLAEDWDLYARMVADVVAGSGSSSREAIEQTIREGTSLDLYRELIRTSREASAEVAGLVERFQVPTLVIGHRDAPVVLPENSIRRDLNLS